MSIHTTIKHILNNRHIYDNIHNRNCVYIIRAGIRDKLEPIYVGKAQNSTVYSRMERHNHNRLNNHNKRINQPVGKFGRFLKSREDCLNFNVEIFSLEESRQLLGDDCICVCKAEIGIYNIVKNKYILNYRTPILCKNCKI